MDIKIDGPDSREILREGARPGHAKAACTSSARWPRRSAAPRDELSQVRAAHHHAAGQARPDPRHHRPGRQDDPRASSSRPASPSTSRTTAPCQHRVVGRRRRPRRRSTSSRASPPSPRSAQFYKGVVKRIADFGAFVEILPGHRRPRPHLASSTHKRVEQVDGRPQGGRRGAGEGHQRSTARARSACRRKEALGEDAGVVHNSR